MQFAIGHLGIGGGIIAFPQDRHLIAARRQMPIKAGDGGIQHPIFKPFDRNIAVEIGVLVLGRRLHPGNALGFFAPEGFGVLGRRVIHGRTLRFRHARLGDDFGFQRNQFISHGRVLPLFRSAYRGECASGICGTSIFRGGIKP